jgi:predicted enzyme related to lactoylglutathione lyase
VTIGELRFLYVGTADTDVSVAHYTSTLGGRLRWRFQHFDADVAAIELGDGPLVLLADHRPAGTVLPLYVVDDLDAAIASFGAGGAVVDGPLESPEGPAIVVHEPGGAELGFIRIDRPGAMDGAWQDEENAHRVR